MYVEFMYAKYEGFLSIGEAEVALSDRGMTRIQGINNYDEGAKSNGAGKSSLLDGILWTLTEETARGTKEVINQNWKGWVLGEVHFKVDNVEYMVRRTKKHPDYGQSLTITKNGEDISGNTYTKSKEILSTELPFLDKDLMTSILLISQGMPGRFSGMKPKRRKERLEELSSSTGFIDELQSRINAKSKSLNKLISEDEKKYEANKSSIQVHRSSIASKKAYIEQQTKVQTEGLTQEEYNQLHSQLTEVQAEYTQASGMVSKLDERFTIKLGERGQLVNQMNQFDNQIAQDNMTIRHAETTIANCKEQITSLASEMQLISHSTCYACEQQIVDMARVDKMKADITDKIMSHKAQISTSLHEIENAKQHIQSTQLAKQGTESGIALIEDELNSIKNEKAQWVDKVTQFQLKINPINDKLRLGVKTETSLDFVNSEIAQHEEQVIKLEKELETLNADITSRTKEADILNWLGRQSSREFRSYLLQGVVDYLNKRLGNHSSILYNNDTKIELKLHKNDLDLYYSGKAYENLSGGERRRVDLCMQLALRDLTINETGLVFNILGLDEIFDNLDAEGISRVLELIKNVASEVSSLLIITHSEILSMPYDSQIVIEKTHEGFSRVVESY